MYRLLRLYPTPRRVLSKRVLLSSSYSSHSTTPTQNIGPSHTISAKDIDTKFESCVLEDKRELFKVLRELEMERFKGVSRSWP